MFKLFSKTFSKKKLNLEKNIFILEKNLFFKQGIIIRSLSNKTNYDSKLPVNDFSYKNKLKSLVFAWGLSATGAIGNIKYFELQKDKYEKIIKPYRVRFFEKMKVNDIAAGYGYTIFSVKALDTDHVLFGTGLNTDFQLGYQKDYKTNELLKQVILPTPISLPIKKNTKIKSLACGRAHTIVLTSDNTLFSLGNNSFGQCGREPIQNEQSFLNIQVFFINGIEETVNKVICGQDHTIFLTENGQLYSCGWGVDGQTGLGHYNIQGIPKKIGGDISGEKIVAVSTSADAVLAINEKGDLFGWGNSEYAQFRRVTDKMQLNVPRHLKFDSLKDKKIIDVACGGTTCAVLDDDGCVHVWGYGILGKGPKIDHLKEPSMIPKPLFGYNEMNDKVKVIKIEAGLGHFGAITNNGDLFMWGKNRDGCLGLDQFKDQFFPLKVPLAVSVNKISLGVDHTVVLASAM